MYSPKNSLNELTICLLTDLLKSWCEIKTFPILFCKLRILNCFVYKERGLRGWKDMPFQGGVVHIIKKVREHNLDPVA